MLAARAGSQEVQRRGVRGERRLRDECCRCPGNRGADEGRGAGLATLTRYREVLAVAFAMTAIDLPSGLTTN